MSETVSRNTIRKGFTCLHRFSRRLKLFSLGKILRVALPLATFVDSAGLPAHSQMNTGEIDGLVRDPSGAVIAGASIEAVETSTQLKYSTTTNTAGEFLLAQLPVGAYTLTVSSSGFKQVVQSGVSVHAGERIRQIFSLALGEQSETVTVVATGGLLQVESAAIQDTVEQEKIISLPLKGRQFIDLVGLTPGITHAPSGTRGAALQQTGQTWGILGQRGGHNLYLVDGVTVTDEFYNNMTLNPSVDDIQEFNVNQTSYNAEFGGKSGGVINVITKSGSNIWHGSLFEFVRNDAFNARNFFSSPAAPAPPYKQNEFGGSLGGPLHHDKTFFFLNYEGQRTHQAQTQLFTVPTDAERAGNFTGTGIIVTDPSGMPYPNDTLPSIDPVAAAVLAKMPHATTQTPTSNNLLATDLAITGVNQYNLRVDHSFSQKDSVFARASILDANQFNPFGLGALNEAILPGFGYNLRTHTDNLSAAWTHIFNTSWMNELRFGWMWVNGGQSSTNAGTDLSAAGLQGVTTNPLDMGYPSMTVTGFSTMGEPTQYVSRTDNNYEVYDNAIWHHGRHTVKFGAYFFHLDFDPVNAANARGTFQFTSLVNFLTGDPKQAQVGVQGRGALLGRSNWLHTYIEDSWQIIPSLKLDVGVRYEYNQNVTDVNNNMAVVNNLIPGGEFVIASNNQGQISPAAAALLSSIPIPYVTSVQAGWNNSLLTPRPLRLAPRIGLAWTLPDQKTVIRSGFGIYTNQAAYSVIQGAAQNLPFYSAKTVANNSGANTENILVGESHGHGQRQQHQSRLQNRIQQRVERLPAKATFRDDVFAGAIHRLLHGSRRQHDAAKPLSGLGACSRRGWTRPPHFSDERLHFHHLGRLGKVQRAYARSESASLAWPDSRFQLHLFQSPGRRFKPRPQQCRVESSAGSRQHGGGSGTLRFRSPQPLGHKFPV